MLSPYSGPAAIRALPTWRQRELHHQTAGWLQGGMDPAIGEQGWVQVGWWVGTYELPYWM